MDKIALINVAGSFVNEFKNYDLNLDYSLDSLKLIEDYISSNSKNSKPSKKSLFHKDTDSKAYALGTYLGEVIRKNGRGIRWNSEGAESPMDITLNTPDGGVALVINKAFKRIYQGEGDNIHHFAAVMLKDFLKYEEEIPADFYDEDDLRIEKYGGSPLAVYSKRISENNDEVQQIYHEDGRWYFTSSDEAEKEQKKEDYNFMFLDEVKEKHPEFADLLVAEDKLRIVRQDDGTYRSQKQHKALFYDSHTIPSYQGDMKLKIFQWIKYNFIAVVKPILFLIIGYFLMTKVHWIFCLIFIAALLYMIWYWLQAINRFKGGDVNPGKVISVDPPMVAVASDMRKISGDFPILKIIKTKLPKEDLELNKVIPTVALYNDNPHGYPFWAEFHPVPVIHGISDRKHIDHIMSNFSKVSLNDLDVYIAKASKTEPGIYKIDEDSSNWSNFKHVDISKGISMEKPIEESGNS